MPLLGKLLFNETGEDIPTDSSKEVYEISHTGEQFVSKELYDERLQFYGRKVWTCQCTGHINLTHAEATESEKKSKKRLAKTFHEIYEQPVLNIVHHSSEILEKVVDRAYRLVHSQLFLSEIVSFEGVPGRKHGAKIVKVCEEEKKLAESGSPSSDKENNSSKQALISDIFRPDKSSGQTSSDSSSGDSTLTLSSKIKYDILLLKENKVICGVPVTTLKRNEKPPRRNAVKLFIRCNSFRCEYKKHKVWMVNKEMVEKHKLCCKLNPQEEKKYLEASSISSKGFVGYPHHGGSIHVNGDSVHVENKLEGDKLQNSLLEDQDANKDPPMKKLAPIFSPKSKTKPKLKNGIELSSIKTSSSVKTPSAKTTKLQLKRKHEDKKSHSKSPKKKKVAASVVEISDNDDDLPLSKLAKAMEHSNTHKTSSRKNTSPKKKRQATLLELTKKKGGKMLMTSKKSLTLGSSPASSPSKKTQRAPRQPPIVYRLLRLKQEKKFQRHKYKMLLNDTARMLNEKQRSNLPELVKQEVILKWEMIERKRKWDNMTPEERKITRNAERIIKNKKHEDMDILAKGDAKSLPVCEPVIIPGGLPNTMFGNIAMVTEFLYCHKTLLSTCCRDLQSFNYWTIAEALSSGKNGFDVISQILICIFQILLSDGVADGYKDLDFHIDEVPKTPEVCSELARICLRQFDDDLETQNNRADDDDDTSRTPGTGISEETFLKLLDNEIYELNAGDQLEVLCSLIYRFINTYSAQNFRDDMKEKSSNAWKKFCKLRMEDNLLKKEKKMKEEQEKESPTNEAKGEDKSEDNKVVEENNDLVSRVKRRRVDAVERKRIEEEKRLEWDEQRRKLFEEQAKVAETDKLRKQVHDTEASSSRAFRLTTLGTDRHHSRYWSFSEHTPGLYIEKGWIGDSINYTTYSISGDKKIKSDLLTSTDDSAVETTLPHVGQNLWFVVDSKEKLDDLISSLCHNGFRESGLKKTLEKKYSHIIKSISKYENNLPKQSTDTSESEKVSPYVTRKSLVVKDAAKDCKKVFRKRLQTMIHDISKGNLGNIQDDYEVFVARIDSAEEVSDFKSLFLDIFNAIDMRFFRQYMNGCATKKNQTREELLPYEEQEKQLANSKKIAQAEKRRERWIAAVEGAVHFSRLSFLLTILHSNVMWEMYKYCRTAPKRQSARIKNYASMVEQDEDDDDHDDEEEEGDEAPITEISARGLRRSRRNKEFEESMGEEDEESSNDDDQENEEEEDGEEESSASEEEENSEEEEEIASEDEEIGKCSAIINRLLQYKCSSFFRYRVEEEDVPDYYDVIQNPICLLDIKEKIERAEGAKERNGNTRTRSITRGPPAVLPYSPDQLLDDIHLVLDNAEVYNGHDSPVWRQAMKLKSAFSRCFLENFRHSVRLTKKLRVMFSDEN